MWVTQRVGDHENLPIIYMKFCVENIHFSLESDVKKTLLLLLETDIDAERKDRVKGDKFCKLFEQIRSGERKISLSKRETEKCWILHETAVNELDQINDLFNN